MKNKKYGFTLAEVLVTLMIIGVIASVTIPGLRKSADESERVAQVKKCYSTLASATDLLRAEYGPIKHWNWTNTDEIMDEMFIPKFNILKNCKKSGACFDSSYVTKSPGGSVFNEFQSSDWYTFVGADGVFWTVSKGVPGCTGEEGSPAYIKNSCMYFEVDVNGTKKPNQVGLDIFGFTVTPEGAFPYGGCPDCSDETCSVTSGSGWACTAKLIKHGKFDW